MIHGTITIESLAEYKHAKALGFDPSLPGVVAHVACGRRFADKKNELIFATDMRTTGVRVVKGAPRFMCNIDGAQDEAIPRGPWALTMTREK